MGLSNLFDSLSRIPGLGFFHSMRDSIDRAVMKKDLVVGQGKNIKDDVVGARDAIGDMKPSKNKSRDPRAARSGGPAAGHAAASRDPRKARDPRAARQSGDPRGSHDPRKPRDPRQGRDRGKPRDPRQR